MIKEADIKNLVSDNFVAETLRDYTESKDILKDKSIRVFGEMSKYLIACGNSTEALSPSEEVDDLWHMMLESRDEYKKLCNTLGVYEIQHYPLVSGEESPLISRSVSRIIELGFSVDLDIWNSNTGSTEKGGGKCKDKTSNPGTSTGGGSNGTNNGNGGQGTKK